MRWAIMQSRKLSSVMALTILLAAAAGCTRYGATPVPYDQVDCQYCRMRITDRRYGGELVTRTGRALYFDSIECLAGYVSTLGTAAADSALEAQVWVANYAQPGTLIAARDARLLRAAAPAGEMGHGIVAIDEHADTASIRHRVNGTWVTWQDILADARREKSALAADIHAPSR